MSEYLVHHGCAALLTRCRAGAAPSFRRGDRVVIRSPRGLELGEVLCEATLGHALLSPNVADGELLRVATAADERSSAEQRRRGERVFDLAQRQIEGQNLPLALLDIEVMLDGKQAVLHVLRWGDADLEPFARTIEDAHGLTVVLRDTGQPAEEPEPEHAGCGEGGCGSGGCGEGGCGDGGCSTGGCSTGSCSSSSFQNADQLTAYFLELREKLFAAPGRTSLL